MIYLKNLFKALVKPRSVFEELQGQVRAREGFLAWGLCMIIGFMPAYLVARKLDFPFFFIDFGVGSSVEILKILAGLGLNLVLFLAVSFIATFVARKLGGTGNFQETLGMLGYTKAIIVLKGLMTSIFTFILWARVISALRMGAEGGAIPPELISVFITPAFICIGFFMVWTLFLESTALSVSNGISMKKAVPIMLVLMILVNTLMGILL
ncbi:MAG: YIP1 family protein [archaeon]